MHVAVLLHDLVHHSITNTLPVMLCSVCFYVTLSASKFKNIHVGSSFKKVTLYFAQSCILEAQYRPERIILTIYYLSETVGKMS